MSTFGTPLWGGAVGGAAGSSSGTPLRPLLYLALRLAGVTRGPGRVPSTDQFADALAQANLLISQWNVTGAMIFTSSINTFTLTAGKKLYTAGPGGDFDMARPQSITGAVILFPGTPVVRREITVTEEDSAWREIAVQDITGVPRLLYNDGETPLANLRLYPQADAGYSLELYTWLMLSSFVTADDVLLLPPGYDDALTYALAVRLNSTFKSVAGPLDPEVKNQAINSRRAITTRNSTPPRMRTDQLGGRGGRSINWLEREG